MRRVIVVAVVAVACSVLVEGASPNAIPLLQFKVFVNPDIPKLGQVVWTGKSFIYISELHGQLNMSDPQGSSVTPFARFNASGEMRCAPSPGGGWRPGLFCHTANNRVLNVSADGSTVTVVAKLPAAAGRESDGGITFDHVGTFGRRMLVSSGGSDSNGGNIYAITPVGKVSLIGSYPGPGGADNIVVAPARFGTAGGSVVIASDQAGVTGTVLAMDHNGVTKVLAAHLANGVDTIQVIAPPPSRRRAGSAVPGLYFGDQTSGNVYYTPAGPLRRYNGNILVGGEAHAWFWVLRPKGKGFVAVRLKTNLASKQWVVEGGAYVP